MLLLARSARTAAIIKYYDLFIFLILTRVLNTNIKTSAKKLDKKLLNNRSKNLYGAKLTYVKKKLSQRIAVLKKIRHFLPHLECKLYSSVTHWLLLKDQINFPTCTLILDISQRLTVIAT